MRFLIWHVDRFKSTITQRGRSPIVEPYDSRDLAVGEALLVLASVEAADSAHPDVVAERAATEIEKLARQLKVETVVLHSFAHLFAELAPPDVAISVLEACRQHLEARGLRPLRTPFGWFNQLEIKAKGHPLSRVARRVSAEGS